MGSVKFYNEKGKCWQWFNSNDKLHNEDGPAIECDNGDKYWFIEGKLHRENGPAVEYIKGDKEWWIYGELYKIDKYSHKVYYFFGDLYRINKYTHTVWLDKKGSKHRIGGPAVEYINGDEEWWVEGRLHRLDGPAVIRKNLTQDKKRSFYMFNSVDKTPMGLIEWRINGELHREDGPAFISDFYRKWYFNGKLHREDGPAIECLFNSTQNEYWFDGFEYTKINSNKIKIINDLTLIKK
jgi:hypothetical protein